MECRVPNHLNTIALRNASGLSARKGAEVITKVLANATMASKSALTRCWLSDCQTTVRNSGTRITSSCLIPKDRPSVTNAHIRCLGNSQKDSSKKKMAG